jgi:hypothetical protein
VKLLCFAHLAPLALLAACTDRASATAPGAYVPSTPCLNDVRRACTHRARPIVSSDRDGAADDGARDAANDDGPGASRDAESVAPDALPSDARSARSDAEPPCDDAIEERLATLLDDWPLLTPGRETRSFSSYDRTGGNSDGFDGTYSELYVNAAGEHVIFDALGPGVLDTLWFTGPKEGGAGLDLGTIHFYLDDEPTPRIAIPWADLFSGDHEPFLAPLVTDNHSSTGAFVSWVPVPFARRLIVTTGVKPGFYQAHYETYPADAVVTSFDGCTPMSSRRLFQDAIDVRPSTEVATVPLDSTFSGAGTLDVIQFQPEGAPAESDLQAARIQIFWDGEATPSVDAPLGAFFGSGLGTAVVRALPLSMNDGLYESRFRMPFWTGFRLSITGLAGTLRTHVGPSRYPRSGSGYFHAHASEAMPTTPGADFEWLGDDGAGKLIGTVLTVHPASATTKKWWEGDTRSYANGRRTPGIDGTGHEDDHLGAWSTTLFENPFTLPLHGVPATTILDLSGQVNANATFYRFYPGIEFVGGIRHSTEHGSRNGVAGNYAGVAFYYADASGTSLVDTDRLTVADATSRTDHAYTADGESTPFALSSSFEGRDDQTMISETTVDHTGAAGFDVKLDIANRGCFLRRTYDQKNGRQRARVRVDGADVGDWYVADFNATHRWAERDYFLSEKHTAKKTTVHVEIVPATASPAWSIAEYRVLCVVLGK